MPIKARLALMAGALVLAAVPAAAQDDLREAYFITSRNCGAWNLILSSSPLVDYEQRRWHAKRTSMWIEIYREQTGFTVEQMKEDVQVSIARMIGPDWTDVALATADQIAEVEEARRKYCDQYGG